MASSMNAIITIFCVLIMVSLFTVNGSIWEETPAYKILYGEEMTKNVSGSYYDYGDTLVPTGAGSTTGNLFNFSGIRGLIILILTAVAGGLLLTFGISSVTHTDYSSNMLIGGLLTGAVLLYLMTPLRALLNIFTNEGITGFASVDGILMAMFTLTLAIMLINGALGFIRGSNSF